MPSITLFTTHAHPHCRPLRVKHWLDNPWYLVHQRQAAVDVIQHLDFSGTLPRHGHVLQELKHSMRHKLQRSKVAPLIAAELLLRHVSDIFHNLSQMLRGHIRLLCLDESTPPLLAEPLFLHAKPFFLLLCELRDLWVGGGSISRRRRGEGHSRWSTGRRGRSPARGRRMRERRHDFVMEEIVGEG